MATRVAAGTQSHCTGASSLTTSSPSATAGNKLILQVSWVLSTGGSATPGTISGWTKDYGPVSSFNGTNGSAGYAHYSKTAAGGVESPVFNSPDASSNLYANAIITEWSGMGAHDTNDSTATITNNTGGTSSGTTVPNTGTLANANSTVFTGLGFLSSVGLSNANFAFSGGGWTTEAIDNDTGASAGSLMGSKTVSANTALGAVYTWSNTDATILCFQAAVVVYSDSGAAATSLPIPQAFLPVLFNF